MRRILPMLVFFATTTAAVADGFVMGAGRWTCSDAIRVYEGGSPAEKGQLAG